MEASDGPAAATSLANATAPTYHTQEQIEKKKQEKNVNKKTTSLRSLKTARFRGEKMMYRCRNVYILRSIYRYMRWKREGKTAFVLYFFVLSGNHSR